MGSGLLDIIGDVYHESCLRVELQLNEAQAEVGYDDIRKILSSAEHREIYLRLILFGIIGHLNEFEMDTEYFFDMFGLFIVMPVTDIRVIGDPQGQSWHILRHGSGKADNQHEQCQQYREQAFHTDTSLFFLHHTEMRS